MPSAAYSAGMGAANSVVPPSGNPYQWANAQLWTDMHNSVNTAGMISNVTDSVNGRSWPQATAGARYTYNTTYIGAADPVAASAGTTSDALGIFNDGGGDTLAATLGNAAEWTVSFLIVPSTSTVQGLLRISNAAETSSRYWSIRAASGNWEFRVVSTPAFGAVQNGTPNNTFGLPIGLSNYCMKYSEGFITGYGNGVQIGSPVAYSNPAITSPSRAALTLGSSTTTGFDGGVVGILAAWDRALTDAEILYQSNFMNAAYTP